MFRLCEGLGKTNFELHVKYGISELVSWLLDILNLPLLPLSAATYHIPQLSDSFDGICFRMQDNVSVKENMHFPMNI